jgi:predicted glycoside hydrolase/deacetylase ChbG (UPF0249 family)
MEASRLLMVVADDYGIGPETSRAILELTRTGVVTGTVLLVNSPYVESAVKAWRSARVRADLGWHPCLTMDPPVAPAREVASLLGPDGCMLPLRQFLPRLLLRQIRPEHIHRELRAQWERFRELTGSAPSLVNTHQHVGVFPPVGAILRDLLRLQSPQPFLRRVCEPWSSWLRVPGARVKRVVLSLFGAWQAAKQIREGFAGADALAGITNPEQVSDPRFFDRWLSRIPGRIIELMCHPGHFDPTLIGRDCRENDGLQQRRVDEYQLLRQPAFVQACRAAGFALSAPSELHGWITRESRNVA